VLSQIRKTGNFFNDLSGDHSSVQSNFRHQAFPVILGAGSF